MQHKLKIHNILSPIVIIFVLANHQFGQVFLLNKRFFIASFLNVDEAKMVNTDNVDIGHATATGTLQFLAPTKLSGFVRLCVRRSSINLPIQHENVDFSLRRKIPHYLIYRKNKNVIK